MRVGVGITLALTALGTPILPPDVSAQVLSLKTVLTIHVGAEHFPTNPLLEAGIRDGLKSSDSPIDYFAEYLESDDFPQEEASRAFDDYIHRKYQGRRIDLLITTTDVGLNFLLDRRAELFPDAPIVFAAVDVPGDVVRRTGGGATGIKIGFAHAETLKLALALHPSTEQLFLVASRMDQAMAALVQVLLRDFGSRVKLTLVDEPTVPRLLTVVKAIPPRSLIIYLSSRQDVPGQRLATDQIAPLVAGAARVPVYGTSDIYIGSGVVGGVVRDTRESGARLGAIALRILSGTRAQDIPIEETRVAPIFDRRALQRWGISENRLPPGSVIRFQGPSLWRDYRSEVITGLTALVLQSLVIVALLYQRRARQRAEAALAGIIEGSDDAIVSKDLSGTIMSWNRGAERIFGYTTQEMVGRSIRTIIPDYRWSEEDEVLRKIRDGEKVSHFETERRRKDGSEVHVSLTISPIYSTAGVIVGASKIARDISDRKRAEVESRRNLALAADASRRMTLTALTGSIAHELGQPLNSIQHNAQAGELLIASQRATPEKLREILAAIRTADLRATQIIERHRTMLRTRQLNAETIDIQSVVRESVALVADNSRSKKIAIDLELAPNPCAVVGDPVLLQQVVVNLMMNAMDAMAETPPERRRITVQDRIASRNVEVSVLDAGTGLAAGFDGELFEPFVTTKTNGMGIGLTIARSIIEAHRGTITAQNNPEGGATFTISLPCAETSVNAGAQADLP